MAIREELWDFPHAMQLKVMGAADAPQTLSFPIFINRRLPLPTPPMPRS